MSDVVIRAEGLGKKYMIGHQSVGGESYASLRDVVSRQAKAFVRSARDMFKGRQIVAGDEVEEFWALKDVSFEIKRGEVVGIIGRNGAGKSTLLKVLSRITEPSTGRVEINGRIASLLEVGTGFHPELSGRENIFLNGAVLGMSRAEVRRKFDEIVAFSEVEKFLDTPVKRYSSGMYVRLAFAIAAHLDPEILIVDEVLAVGDAEFQNKCMGRMSAISATGRTVLFVSHNEAVMKKLCPTLLLLQSGKIAEMGDASMVLQRHRAFLNTQSRKSLAIRTDRQGNGEFRIVDVWLESEGSRVSVLEVGAEAVFCFKYETNRKMNEIHLAFDLYKEFGESISLFNTRDTLPALGEGGSKGVLRCVVPRFPMREGVYASNIFCMAKGEISDWIQHAFSVTVRSGDYFGNGPSKDEFLVSVSHEWHCNAF